MNGKRYNRHLTIEQTSPTLKVTFFWHEGESEYFADRVQHKDLEFFPQTMETAARSLDIFFMYGTHFMKIEDQIFIRSLNCDHLAYYFDGVIDSDNPEQVFISKYILEDAQQRAEGYRHDRHQ